MRTKLSTLADVALRDVFSNSREASLCEAAWQLFVSRHSLDGRGYRDPIVTDDRGFDWMAYRDSDPGLTGRGRTEVDAVHDLVALEAGRRRVA